MERDTADHLAASALTENAREVISLSEQDIEIRVPEGRLFVQAIHQVYDDLATNLCRIWRTFDLEQLAFQRRTGDRQRRAYALDLFSRSADLERHEGVDAVNRPLDSLGTQTEL